jgi:hypothetical protein
MNEKKQEKLLELHKETVRTLTRHELRDIAGAASTVMLEDCPDGGAPPTSVPPPRSNNSAV